MRESGRPGNRKGEKRAAESISQSGQQVFDSCIRILQDLAHQTDAEHLTRMNRNDRTTTIQMAEKIVTALDSNHLKPPPGAMLASALYRKIWAFAARIKQ
jgi:hypothetical protein